MDRIDIKPLGLADDDGTSRKIAVMPSFQPLNLATGPSPFELSALTPPAMGKTATATAAPPPAPLGGPVTVAPPLGPFNTLSPTTTVFCPQTTVSVASARVVDFLHSHNGTNSAPKKKKTLGDDDDDNTISRSTSSYKDGEGVLECTVRLGSGGGLPVHVDVSFFTPNKASLAHGVIVEVRNNNASGAPSAAFYDVARALLDAAQGKQVSTLKSSATVYFPPLPPPPPQMGERQDSMGAFKRRQLSPQEDADNLVKKVNPLVQHAANVGLCQLGLDLLLPLTDKKRMGVEVVQKVCEKLLQENDEDFQEDVDKKGSGCLLRRRIMKLCEQGRGEHLGEVAWTVLVNALENVELVADTVRNELEDLAETEIEEQDGKFTAQQATRCLQLLE